MDKAKKKKQPFVERIAARLMAKFSRDGLNAASVYGASVVSMHPMHAAEVLRRAPTEVRVLVEEQIKARKHKRREVQERKDGELASYKAIIKARESARLLEVEKSLQSARAIGQAVPFLAALPVADRKHLATREEERFVIDERSDSIKMSAVRASLQCTLTELNRWTADGRLPILFTRRIPTPGGTVEARFWRKSDVEDAREKCSDWRQEDAAAKAAARRKPKQGPSM